MFSTFILVGWFFSLTIEFLEQLNVFSTFQSATLFFIGFIFQLFDLKSVRSPGLSGSVLVPAQKGDIVKTMNGSEARPFHRVQTVLLKCQPYYKMCRLPLHAHTHTCTHRKLVLLKA